MTPGNVNKIKKIILNAQTEVIGLRKKLKAHRMQVYRYKTRTHTIKSVLSQVKKRKFLNGNDCEIVEVRQIHIKFSINLKN